MLLTLTKRAMPYIVFLAILALLGSCDKSTDSDPSPNAPVLTDPGTTDSDGNYTVEWTRPSGANNFTLQEDSRTDFTSPEQAYYGSASQVQISDRQNGTYYYRVRCSGDNGSSGWSNTESITVELPETITTPNVPVGPATGDVGESLTYTTGGAYSSLNHTLEYRFDWGDGSYSSWSTSSSASHSYSTAGTNSVRAQARCMTHTSVLSAWSGSIPVEIGGSSHEVTRPTYLTGATSGYVDSTYSFSTGGSVCSQGHPVQYRFFWGSGSPSNWSSSTSASHWWDQTGTFYVNSQARCSVDTTVVSETRARAIDIIDPSCFVTVTQPNTTTGVSIDDQLTIEWSTSGVCGSSVSIDLYKAGSYLCSIASSTANDGSFNWTVSDCGSGSASDYTIRVASISSGSSDFSEPFTIYTQLCILDVTSPHSQDNWIEGETHTIEWAQSADGGCGDRAQIELYDRNGPLCFISDYAPNTGSYEWVVEDCGGSHAYSYPFRIKVSSFTTGDSAFSSWFNITPEQCTIDNAWWSNETDTDGDGYTSGRTLYFSTTCDGDGDDVYATVLYKEHSESNWTEYDRISVLDIPSTQSITIGYPSDELDHADIYDFQIQLRTPDWHDSLIASIDNTDDDDLNAENFESRATDVVYTIEDCWWTNITDSDGDGYRSAGQLNFDVDVSSGSYEVYADIGYALYPSESYSVYTTTMPFTASGSTSHSVSIGYPNDDLEAGFYHFYVRIYYYYDDETEVANRNRYDDDDLNMELFEPRGED